MLYLPKPDFSYSEIQSWIQKLGEKEDSISRMLTIYGPACVPHLREAFLHPNRVDRQWVSYGDEGGPRLSKRDHDALVRRRVIRAMSELIDSGKMPLSLMEDFQELITPRDKDFV